MTMMKKNHIVDGMKDALPIVFGYAPLGIALGIMANQISMSGLQMFGMSAIVFAGSAQFVGIDMLSTGSAAALIIITTFFINFRHFLMSAAYSPYFQDTKTSHLLLMSFGITDESFAVGINKCKNDPENASISYILSLNTTAYISWIIFTVIGVYLGDIIVDYHKFGLDFALTAMFIGLISLMATDKKSVFVCVLSGFLSLLLLRLGVQNYNVIIAAVIASVIVVSIGERYERK